MKRSRSLAGLAFLAINALAGMALAQNGEPPAAKAHVITRVAPQYPMSVRRAGIEGSVVAWVRVDSEGNVRSVRIRRSPHEALSDAAENALRQWKFQPMERDGKPIPFTAEYSIDFHLTDDDPIIASGRPPPPSETDVSKYVAAPDGVDSFRNEYWKAPSHRAFASSDEGSWGWSQNATSADHAVELARENCERYRRREDRPCKLVHIDGEWQERGARQPKPLRLLPANEIAYFRSDTVESWPEDKKLRASSFLAQCREASASFIETWKSGDADALYRTVAQELRDQYLRSEFGERLGDMKSLVGTMISATFFQEALMIPKRDEETLIELHAQVVYSAVTSKWKAPGVMLVMNMSPEGGTCRVAGFTYVAVSGALPPWLRDDDNGPSRGT